jgi:hypothetical protein
VLNWDLRCTVDCLVCGFICELKETSSELSLELKILTADQAVYGTTPSFLCTEYFNNRFKRTGVVRQVAFVNG